MKKQKCIYEDHKSRSAKIWHFLAHEDSWLSFIADAVLILVVGKFIVFPLLGLALGTGFPIVAVVSGSMDHNSNSLDLWWATNGKWYEEHNISKEQFQTFYRSEGFSKGDVLAIKGVDFSNLEIGDIIIYSIPGRRDPIIHRIVYLGDGFVRTKGDANLAQISFENFITPAQVQGKAVVLVPYLGWIKVGVTELFA